jgi:hypothetical protein
MRLKRVLQTDESMFELFSRQGNLAGMKVHNNTQMDTC